jgi:large subunit ribosomal protein L19
MKNRYIEKFEQDQIAGKEVPSFRAGDTLRVAVNIKEGSKSRVQNFEGVCIAIRGEGTGRTFMIRKIGANGIGVERIFPIYSESIEDIKVLRRGRVRRAKLFYLRDRQGKAARIKELRIKLSPFFVSRNFAILFISFYKSF